ncbi:hypothetical protein DFH07DRAFT_721568, partial [Mycena maculata]
PTHVRLALNQYGSHRCHQSRTMRHTEELTDLVDAFADDPRRSLSDLGQTLVEMILRNESLVRNYFMNPFEEDTSLALDLGGTLFNDILRLCGEAVRNSGPGSQTDIAGNILQLEFLLSGKKNEEASILARSCIERHPSVAFFYYVVA